ncbi:MAG: chorismate synthase [Micrococcales bacterium]|nr:chorismate synthase [Micrococcales bacterium]NBR55024.1 chorismate synthase [Micrococcales bacterium]NBR61558.1 chorismate synthase [Actinomycetota bacterium]NBT49049.1 chorismate synthase [Actinomycetota bacterium]NBY44261.1 chorismate synthase [Micrococcales bacterium]
MLRWLTAGESHGPELTAVLEGLPAGVPVTTEALNISLARRRFGYGRGARMKIEQDQLRITGGVRHGLSMGGPISIVIENTEWDKWIEIMSPDPVDSSTLTGARAEPLTRPRPGHADFTGMQKYGFTESRPVLERASARETAARVALGSIVESFLAELGISVVTHTVSIGKISGGDLLPKPTDVVDLDEDPVRAFDTKLSQAMVEEIDQAHKDGDTLGGVVEVLVYGMPPGVGSYVHWDRRLDGRLAGALMSIQAIKGVAVGDGFESATRRGSEAHDEMQLTDGLVARITDRAGGIEGGMSNGEIIRVRAAMKPISTVPRALKTIDVATGEESTAHHQRSDVCAVPAAGVVAQAMVSLTIADAVLEKFGGDSVAETKRNLASYLESIPANLKSKIVS